MALGLWSQEMKDRIIMANGSVQQIQEIPESTRILYKTVWEIKQKAIIDHARARAPFICQTQSMNLFIKDPTIKVINACHFYSWRAGLKTGVYYLRTLAKSQAQKVTIDVNTNSTSSNITNINAPNKSPSRHDIPASSNTSDEPECLNCSA
jgi:ribonucleoside-diphosphate reductase alpha chain